MGKKDKKERKKKKDKKEKKSKKDKKDKKHEKYKEEEKPHYDSNDLRNILDTRRKQSKSPSISPPIRRDDFYSFKSVNEYFKNQFRKTNSSERTNSRNSSDRTKSRSPIRNFNRSHSPDRRIRQRYTSSTSSFKRNEISDRRYRSSRSSDRKLQRNHSPDRQFKKRMSPDKRFKRNYSPERKNQKSISPDKKRIRNSSERNTSPKFNTPSLSSLSDSENEKNKMSDVLSLNQQKTYDQNTKSTFYKGRGNFHQSKHQHNSTRYNIAPPIDQKSWESKVDSFIQNLGIPNVSNNSKEPTETEIKTKEVNASTVPAKEKEGEIEEDFQATPLVKYIGKKMSKSKESELVLQGNFQYNILSLLSPYEWVAAKTLKLLENSGYTEEKLYLSATISSTNSLTKELNDVVHSGKLQIEDIQIVKPQILKVIKYLVQYFTATNEEESEEEEDTSKENISSQKQETSCVSDVIKRFEKKVTKNNDVPSTNIPDQTPVNQWGQYQCYIQTENYKSLADFKTYLSKDMLRLSDSKLCMQGKAFDIALDMVSCFILVDFNYKTLLDLVIKTPVEDILPPKDIATINPTGEINTNIHKRYLFHLILEKFQRMRNNLPKLTDYQLDYCIRKCLQYFMRRCDKTPNPIKNPSGMNIVFNYLPPGIREMDNKPGEENTEDFEAVIEDGQVPQNNDINASEYEESSDPLNSILCSTQTNSDKNTILPPRKYLIAYIHTEWIILRGKPQIYEINIHTSDMSSLSIYTVPEDLQKQPDTMENLGFISNPDRNEIYFVQVGVGCVKTLSMQKAMEKMVNFLEEKRHSTLSESKNNGLILTFFCEEELSVMLKSLESSGQNNIFLDTVKGIGCVEYIVDRFQSKNMTTSGPKLNISGEESFYQTDVKKELKSANFLSKCKAESLYQTLEFFLGETPGYKNFIQPFCFPSLSTRSNTIKKFLKQVEEFYHLEVFIAAELMKQRVDLHLEGIYKPRMGKDLRDKATIVANRICRVLVEENFTKANLVQCFKNNHNFTLNSSTFLNKMTVQQRLKTTDQTIRCIQIIRRFFNPTMSNNDD